MSQFPKYTAMLFGLAFGLFPIQVMAGSTVDVVHFWISQSENAALDIFRKSWEGAGNTWVDLPAKNKISVQRAVSERIVNGYPPAIMQWHANEGAGELVEMGIVLDIDEVAREDNWQNILPETVLDRITYNGQVYFSPTNIHAENWLWTNSEVFRKIGMTPPTTWHDVFAAAKAMQEKGILPIALGGGSWEISTIFNNIMYDKLGHEGYARIIKGDAEAVLLPGIAEALDILRTVSRYTEPAARRVGKSWDDATISVGSGKAGMQFMGDWSKGELISHGFVPGRDFECVLAPGTSIAYFMVIDAFAFPLIDREGVAESQKAFARMVLDRDNQVAFSRLKGSLPVRMDIDIDGLDHCGQLGLQKIIEEKRGINSQSMAMPTHISEGWISVLAQFFNDPDVSSKETQQRLYNVLKQG